MKVTINQVSQGTKLCYHNPEWNEETTVSEIAGHIENNEGISAEFFHFRAANAKLDVTSTLGKYADPEKHVHIDLYYNLKGGKKEKKKVKETKENPVVSCLCCLCELFCCGCDDE